MDYKSLIYNVEDKICKITLNIPERMNAMSTDMLNEIPEAVNTASQDENVNVIVITGNGKGFCVGADLNGPIFDETSTHKLRDIIWQAAEIALVIHESPKPVIASVNGVAAGGGCNLALCCDMIVASEEARFVEGYPNIGMHCDAGGSYFVPRLIGYAKACEFLMTRQFISAREAERIGLINHAVPHDQLESETNKLARAIADGPPMAIRMLKSSINRQLNMTAYDALVNEADMHTFTIISEDAEEGMNAFLEKRKPVFKGK